MRKDNDDARRHLLMRLRLGTIPSPLAVTAAATPYLIASTLILGFVIVGLFLRPPDIKPTQAISPTLIVTPLTLEFGKQEVGNKVVKSVVIKKSSVSNLTWKIVSGNTQWLSITLSNESKVSDNLSEVIYDVTANTSKLHEGLYSVIYTIDAGGVKDQQIQINIQVILPTRQPLPAKLNVNPLTLDFGTLNMGSQMTQLLTVSNSGQMDLNWIVDRGNATWLTPDASQGKIAPGGLPQVIKVMVNTTPLTVSPYSALITFTSNGGTASVNVKLNVVVTPITYGPEVMNVSPSSGLNVGGTTVFITGTGFTDASMVSFGSVQVPASGFTVNSDGQITIANPPANRSDLNSTVDVTVTTPIGTSATSLADHFTYHAPVIPMVTKVSPNKGPIAGGINVTISGTGFTKATVVSFGTVSIAKNNFMVNSDTQITAVSPAPALAGVCAVPCYIVNVDVTVTTPLGTSNINGNDKFTYIPPPIVSSINPMTGPSSGGTSVTIMGAGFTDGSAVSFGTVSVANNNFIVNSDTQITAVSPAGSGTVDVIVTTPGGTSATNLDDQFTYIPLPIVKLILPIVGPVAGGTNVAIFGSHFTNTMSVSFGGTLAKSFIFISDTQITAVSPAGSANNTVPVIVTTPGGSSVTNNDDQFTYLPTPTVTSISPTSEVSTSGGNSVTINGTGFTHVTGVSFDGIAVSKFTFISDTQLSVVSPAVSSCGTVDVTVTTPGGTSATSAADNYSYCPGY